MTTLSDSHAVPTSGAVERVTRLCRWIETAETEPSLKQLADHAGLSPHYCHRLFKSVTGLTPKAFAAACRAGRLRSALAGKEPITGAIYEAGYGSSGRFYTQSSEVLGMTPTQYRNGGPDTRIWFAVGQCTLGSVLVAQTERGVCAILLGDDPAVLVRDLQDRFPAASLVGADPAFERDVAAVINLIDHPGQATLSLPLDIQGTAFQQRVWRALQNIPPGQTASYTDIARAIGSPQAVRAVAGACAANALAVAIPCHRVVRQDGALSGYRWGIERKRSLLAREREDLSRRPQALAADPNAPVPEQS
ncbi:MAG: bifunctional DNA-binding transcriptional regulator/O6-methylguanine-DNA methyltransferase Ada [Marinobacter sp.]|nr:bifunctional DNA-binding transcriptional regulator/O6-methylguanine-DNA methyltransferase Ada [Marinobacter sp.]